MTVILASPYQRLFRPNPEALKPLTPIVQLWRWFQEIPERLRNVVLHVAFCMGHVALVRAIIKHSAYIDRKLMDKMLVEATVPNKKKNLDMIQTLIGHGGDHVFKLLCLHWFSKDYGHDNVVEKEARQVILRHLEDHCGMDIPMLFVCLVAQFAATGFAQEFMSHPSIVSLLLHTTSKPNGETPLHYAAQSRYGHYAHDGGQYRHFLFVLGIQSFVIQLFLKHGSNVNAQNESGNTPLLHMIEGGWLDHIPSHEHRWNMMQLLLNAPGANIHHTNKNGENILGLLCHDHEMVEKLLVKGALAVDESGHRALVKAAQLGHASTVRLLVEAQVWQY